MFRIAMPGADPAAVEIVAELVSRVQGVIDGLPADPDGLEALRRAAAALAKAG